MKNILNTLSSLKTVTINQITALELVNLVIELMTSLKQTDADDSKFRDQELLKILKKLNSRLENLKYEPFVLLLSKILQNVYNMLPVTSSEHFANEYKLLRSVVVDKFLALIDFVIQFNVNPNVHEIFCNMFCRMLTKEKLELHQKHQLLRRFFSLDGHNFILRIIGPSNGVETPINHLKSTLVMAVAVSTFVKILNKSTDLTILDKESYNIVFKADMMHLDLVTNNASYETMMLYTFLKFVDYTWKSPHFNDHEVFYNVSLILAMTKVQKFDLDPTYFHMLTTLFTSTYQPASIHRNLLQIASRAILSSKHPKRLSLNYLKWWKSTKKLKVENFNKAVIDFVKQEENLELESLRPSDLTLFDQKLMLDNLLEPSTLSISALNNLKAILCNFSAMKSCRAYQKLLRRFKNLLMEPAEKNKLEEQRLINVMDVMNSIAGSLSDADQKQKAAKLLMKALKASSTSQHVKLSAVQIAKNLKFNH